MIYTSRQIGETVNEQNLIKAPPVNAGYIFKDQIQESYAEALYKNKGHKSDEEIRPVFHKSFYVLGRYLKIEPDIFPHNQPPDMVSLLTARFQKKAPRTAKIISQTS